MKSAAGKRPPDFASLRCTFASLRIQSSDELRQNVFAFLQFSVQNITDCFAIVLQSFCNCSPKFTDFDMEIERKFSIFYGKEQNILVHSQNLRDFATNIVEFVRK